MGPCQRRDVGCVIFVCFSCNRVHHSIVTCFDSWVKTVVNIFDLGFRSIFLVSLVFKMGKSSFICSSVVLIYCCFVFVAEL